MPSDDSDRTAGDAPAVRLAGDAPAVRLAGAGVRYGSAVALDAVDLVVGRGERVAMVGLSGAGKSTVIALANTSVRASSGAVDVLGQPVADLARAPLRRLRSRVGTVHQGLYLPDALRVAHNVNAGRLGRWSTARALRALAMPRTSGDLGDVVEVLERLGIGHVAWRRTDELSGGERQRVAIARVLLQQPELVLADEPVSALDPARGREIIELLTAQVDASTALLVSLHHYDLAVAYFDRVVGLRHGAVAFDVPAAELRAAPELATALYDLGRPT